MPPSSLTSMVREEPPWARPTDSGDLEPLHARMTATDPVAIKTALRQIPCGLFVMTAAHDGARYGMLARWVQPCSNQPPLVMAAISTGLPIESLIRDSRSFALCQLGDDDRLLRRRFAGPPDRDDDPFVTIPYRAEETGSPILERALTFLDCQLLRHVDLDADHRLYVGRIVAGGIHFPESEPAIEVGGNGMPRRAEGSPPELDDAPGV